MQETEPRNSWRSGSHRQFFRIPVKGKKQAELKSLVDEIVDKKGWSWRRGFCEDSRRQIGFRKAGEGQEARNLVPRSRSTMTIWWWEIGGIEVCWLVCHFDTSWRHLRRGMLNWENASIRLGHYWLMWEGPAPESPQSRWSGLYKEVGWASHGV